MVQQTDAFIPHITFPYNQRVGMSVASTVERIEERGQIRCLMVLAVASGKEAVGDEGGVHEEGHHVHEHDRDRQAAPHRPGSNREKYQHGQKRDGDNGDEPGSEIEVAFRGAPNEPVVHGEVGENDHHRRE